MWEGTYKGSIITQGRYLVIYGYALYSWVKRTYTLKNAGSCNMLPCEWFAASLSSDY